LQVVYFNFLPISRVAYTHHSLDQSVSEKHSDPLCQCH